MPKTAWTIWIRTFDSDSLDLELLTQTVLPQMALMVLTQIYWLWFRCSNHAKRRWWQKVWEIKAKLLFRFSFNRDQTIVWLGLQILEASELEVFEFLVRTSSTFKFKLFNSIHRERLDRGKIEDRLEGKNGIPIMEETNWNILFEITDLIDISKSSFLPLCSLWSRLAHKVLTGEVD